MRNNVAKSFVQNHVNIAVCQPTKTALVKATFTPIMNWEIAIKSFIVYLKLERGLSTNTLAGYKTDLKKLALWADDLNIGPTKLSAKKIQEYIGFLFDQNINARSQARFLSALRSFYKFLILEKAIEIDPTELIESPKLGKTLPDVLSEAEINKIIDGVDLSRPEGERDRAILETLYGCGLRVSELINLKISDLRFKEHYIIVVGKGNKQRIVPINNAAIKCVEIYRTQVRNMQDISRGQEDFLFLNWRGKHLSRVAIFTLVKNLTQVAGIKKNVSPHTFRHSFATHMVNRGANLRVVQDMLGHESITTTEIYAHLSKQKLRETIDKFHPRARL